MPITIEDEDTAALVRELAEHRGLTHDAAVKFAVQAALRRTAHQPSVIDQLRKFWKEHPIPPATGLPADKAFFDDVSGDP